MATAGENSLCKKIYMTPFVFAISGAWPAFISAKTCLTSSPFQMQLFSTKSNTARPFTKAQRLTKQAEKQKCTLRPLVQP